MTCEGRNLPRQLIARKLISSTTADKGTATAASCVSPSARSAVCIWQSARHRIQHRSAPGNTGDLATGADAHWQLCRLGRFRFDAGNSGRDNNQRFVWNWYGFPGVYTVSYI